MQWGIYLVIIGVVLAVGAIVLNNFYASNGLSCAGVVNLCSTNPSNAVSANAFQTTTGNVLNYGSQGLQTIGQYLPLVALVVVASGIILLVVRAFTGATGGGNREF